MIDTNYPPLWGQAEICEGLGCTHLSIKRWREGSGFPDPIAQLRMGGVYDADEVRAWARDRKAPRRADRARLLVAYRREMRAGRTHGAIKVSASEVGVTNTTARAWLRELGEPLPRAGHGRGRSKWDRTRQANEGSER